MQILLHSADIMVPVSKWPLTYRTSLYTCPLITLTPEVLSRGSDDAISTNKARPTLLVIFHPNRDRVIRSYDKLVECENGITLSVWDRRHFRQSVNSGNALTVEDTAFYIVACIIIVVSLECNACQKKNCPSSKERHSFTESKKYHFLVNFIVIV